eukprot:CAMPEP_0194033942 /NCGR_PEP_ID=MMETSP0009_2-20130614/6408_1 /TAXON_ID=210454 /ORGANISM="Grammatophora oceanica, Strain CCMP 410" /LENGTH=576 /DNA_ID=CAMNT_0038674673 /DNA_START=104 /DNA_END=1834 /DNA_ORIENTATION=+
MSIPDIEPSEVGTSGLIWLFLSYGYVLYFASNLISEGSDLLLLIPSMAGLVGGVVLPLLGAVPDGAIMLFSGLGDISEAQETLSVGVGALAGSTIMLLTVPWALSIFGGRVDLDEDGTTANYRGKPKLTPNLSLRDTLKKTGVSLTDQVSKGAVIMMITTIPYFLIQVPAMFLHGPTEQVAEGEKYWALAGLITCLVGFVSYMSLQLQISKKGLDKNKRIAVVKKQLMDGKVSLSGALTADVRQNGMEASRADSYYGAIPNNGADEHDPEVIKYLKEVLREAFMKYDVDNSGHLDKREVLTFFRDFAEDIGTDELEALFVEFDKDGNGIVSFNEFVHAVYVFLTKHTEHSHETKQSRKQAGNDEKTSSAPPERGMVEKQASSRATEEIAGNLFHEDDEEEAEEVPDDFTDLSYEEQQAAIKRRAFFMLAVGTTMVVLFSDPMVDVMGEIANRLDLSPFYVSFILAPLASNASEVLASQYYAAKKTRKTISVSLTALEGAASMNNSFCLSIFMGLVYWRGLAWQYTAETIAIVTVQFIIGALCLTGKSMSSGTGLMVLMIFPLSIVFVAVLEHFGLD